MKRYIHSSRFDVKKNKKQEWRKEHKAGGFRCSHCKQFVIIDDIMGTANRNHCNLCLWSKHVDDRKGDRRARCHGGMEPIGLTFKHSGYGRIGELMLIHRCSICQRISINRIARDDVEGVIISVFNKSIMLPPDIKCHVKNSGIDLLDSTDRIELHRQLFGADSCNFQ